MNMNSRLKEVRLSKGVLIKDVAQELGITVSAYAHYEQGIRQPSIEILKQICIYFDVSADYLIGLSDSY
jgi:transcriptional regulator with XRE-family HTH domain|nr:MAG TPA: helix-turn-helix domain protein [Caudoviricetes sp.]